MSDIIKSKHQNKLHNCSKYNLILWKSNKFQILKYIPSLFWVVCILPHTIIIWYKCDICCVAYIWRQIVLSDDFLVTLEHDVTRCHDISWILSGRRGWRRLVSASIWGVVGERCLAWEDVLRYSLTKTHVFEIILTCKSVLQNGKYIGCL